MTEIEELRAKLAQAEEDAGYWDETAHILLHEKEELRAKIAEARKALEEISAFPYCGTMASMRVAAIAQAALNSLRDTAPAKPNLCDCELSHNGLGVAGRECDCPAGSKTEGNR